MISKYNFNVQNGEMQPRPKTGVFSCDMYSSYNWEVVPHYHACYSMDFIVSGQFEYMSCGNTVLGEAPALFFNLPYITHSIQTQKDTETCRYILYANPELVERFTPQIVNMDQLRDTTMIWTKPSDLAMEQLLLLFKQLHLSKDSDTASLLLPLIIKILFNEANAGNGEFVRMPFPYINDVLRELREHMDTPPSINDVCHRTCVGRSKLLRDFKTVTGETWHQYLTSIRMQHARERLMNGEPILQTALSCGYSTESHFIMTFKKYYGETPGTFLKTTTQ